MDIIRNIRTNDFVRAETTTLLYSYSGNDGYKVAGVLTEDGEFWGVDLYLNETGYTVMGNEYFDKDDAEEYLTEQFWGTFLGDNNPETRELFKHDKPALRETFNDWTDGLHKDGEICDDAANELCLASEELPE